MYGFICFRDNQNDNDFNAEFEVYLIKVEKSINHT